MGCTGPPLGIMIMWAEEGHLGGHLCLPMLFPTHPRKPMQNLVFLQLIPKPRRTCARIRSSGDRDVVGVLVVAKTLAVTAACLHGMAGGADIF